MFKPILTFSWGRVLLRLSIGFLLSHAILAVLLFHRFITAWLVNNIERVWGSRVSSVQPRYIANTAEAPLPRAVNVDGPWGAWSPCVPCYSTDSGTRRSHGARSCGTSCLARSWSCVRTVHSGTDLSTDHTTLRRGQPESTKCVVSIKSCHQWIISIKGCSDKVYQRSPLLKHDSTAIE